MCLNNNQLAIGGGKKTPRSSNIELLRIIAMLFVLIVHADFWSLGGPKLVDFADKPGIAMFRTIVEFISIVCVNVFVMISGWFGIKPGLRGLSNFLFQCVFISTGIYITLLLLGKTGLSIDGIKSCLYLTASTWFVHAYLILYVVSPILNAFIEKANKRQQEIVLLCFYIFQTIIGYTDKTNYFSQGYSPLSFIGLYLLARYLRTYGQRFAHRGLLVYAITVILNSIAYILSLKINLIPDVLAYINPLVVIGAAGLLLWFSKLEIPTNKAINFVSKSAFAVYLIHLNFYLASTYRNIIKNIYNSHSGFICISYIAAVIIGVYIISILVDRVRIFFWDKIVNKVPDIKYADLK